MNKKIIVLSLLIFPMNISTDVQKIETGLYAPDYASGYNYLLSEQMVPADQIVEVYGNYFDAIQQVYGLKREQEMYYPAVFRGCPDVCHHFDKDWTGLAASEGFGQGTKKTEVVNIQGGFSKFKVGNLPGTNIWCVCGRRSTTVPSFQNYEWADE